jgi:hypothetical protein
MLSLRLPLPPPDVGRIGSAADSATVAEQAGLGDTAQRRAFTTLVQDLPLRTLGVTTGGSAATGDTSLSATNVGSASVAKDIVDDEGNKREYI